MLRLLAQIQVTLIFLMQDMRRNVLPKFIAIFMETRGMDTNMAAENQQKHLSPRFATKV